jgi:hypothetical protein
MSDKYKINLTYDYETDESELKRSTNWNGLPSIHRLDAIHDFMGELEKLYKKTYKEFISGFKEPLIGEALLQNMGHNNPEEPPLDDDIQSTIVHGIDLVKKH